MLNINTIKLFFVILTLTIVTSCNCASKNELLSLKNEMNGLIENQRDNVSEINRSLHKIQQSNSEIIKLCSTSNATAKVKNDDRLINEKTYYIKNVDKLQDIIANQSIILKNQKTIITKLKYVMSKDLVKDIVPVKPISPEISTKLQSIPNLAKEQRKEVLIDALQEITQDIKDGSLKDRILRHLSINKKNIQSIQFYIISGTDLNAHDGHDLIHKGKIENRVVVIIEVPNNELWYLLDCANGVVIPAEAIIDKKELIGKFVYSNDQETIYFGFDISKVTDKGKDENDKDIQKRIKALKKIGKIIQRNPNSAIYIYGHADSAGEDNYNIKLSQDRADEIKKYLITKFKVKSNQIIEVVGYGEGKLLVEPDLNSDSAQKNRRVEVLIRYDSLE